MYPKGRDLSWADWLCTETIEECLHNLLQSFSQREVGVGKKPASHWWVMIFSYGWSFLICRDVLIVLEATPQLPWFNYIVSCILQTWFLPGSEHDTVENGFGSGSPPHMQPCGSSEPPINLFSFTAPWGVVVDHFEAHDKPGTSPASVRKYSIYSCMGYL